METTDKHVTFGTALSEATDGRTVRPQCLVCLAVAGLPDVDRSALLDALNDPSIGDTRIARALEMIGHDEVKYYTVNRHRKRSRDASSRCAQQS